jgi:succinyl-CoA synthetase beta subunit
VGWTSRSRCAHPEKIITEYIDPLLGLAPFQARKVAYALKVGEGTPDAKSTINQFVKILLTLGELFVKEDCSLLEVNPLVITGAGKVIALDAKVNLDENAEARHPEWEALRDVDEEDPVELEAKRPAFLTYHSTGTSAVWSTAPVWR